MYSCNVPTIKTPVDSYVINLKRDTASAGKRNLDVKDDHKKVGEWIKKPARLKLDQIPANLTCFKTEEWLKEIKPTLKDGARFYRDYND